MENTKTLEILKQAILLEKRGKAFYSNAAASAKDPDVKKVFQIMADEEEDHIKFLSQQYMNYQSVGQFDSATIERHIKDSVADDVLPNDLADKIAAASFEAAAISSAIDMENRAIAVYSERAKNANDEEERKFYQWLCDWEKGHHKLLFTLDQELKEKIWFDNNFWPM